MEIRLPNKNKKNIIILSILAFIFLASGIYLLWRVNQLETVAPEEGEAAYQCNRCSANYAYAHAYWNMPIGIPQDEIDEKCGGTLDCECAVEHFFEETSTQMSGIHYECDPKCDPEIEGNGSGTSWDGYEACVESLDVPPPPSLDYACARCSRNFIYAYARWNVSEEYKGLCNQAAAEGLWATNEEGSSKPTYTCDCDCVVYEDLSIYDKIVAEGGTLPQIGIWIDSSRSYDQCIEYCSTLTYTLTYSGGTYGTIKGDPVQYVKHGESGTPVTAIPRNSNTHRFVRWSDGRGDNPRTDGNVTKDISVTAVFEEIGSDVTTICGDGVCGEGEDAQNCPADCSAVCGDGYCTHGENALTCPDDCVASCGDGYCTHGENASTCPDDCVASCGDGYCTHNEDALTCPDDCDAVCGDGYCTHDETNETCSKDCPADCGDNYCNPETETAANCPADCSAVCGDGYCTHDENASTCPADCVVQTQESPKEPETPPEEPLPETGIFDDGQSSLILGFVLLILGFTWRLIGSNTLLLVNKVSKERELKKSIKRKKNFERKVVKD